MLPSYIAKDTPKDVDEAAYYEARAVFGRLVKFMRKRNGWTQKDLVEQIGDANDIPLIPLRTLGDIERGEKAVLDYVTVTRLADGFNLEGMLREEFFAFAGLNINATSLHDITPVEEESIYQFYQNTFFPAYCHDSLLNLHSVNSYLFVLFGIDLADFKRELFSAAGPNMLRIIFDPQFDMRTLWLKGEQWRPYVETNVYLFRVLSKRHIGTQAYIRLLRELRELPEFIDVWHVVERKDFRPAFPIPSVFRMRSGGELQFTIVSTPDSTLSTSRISKVLYVPVNDETNRQLAEVHRQMPNSYVRFDRTQPSGFVQVTLGT